MEALAPVAYGFVLVFFRTAALMITAPLFGIRSLPAQLRVALSACVAFVAFTGAGLPQVPVPAHLGVLLSDVALETVLGLFAGNAVRFALEAAASAGQLTAQAMGLGYGAMLDPLNGAESTALGQLFRMLVLGAALALGLHREAVAWLASSVTQVPPGTVTGLTDLARASIVQALEAIALSVRLGFPFLAAVTLGHLVLGLVGRAAQQLHFSNLGFSVSILFGGGALWVVAPPMLRACAQSALHYFPGG